MDSATNYFFFVIGWNQHGYFGVIRQCFSWPAKPVFPHAIPYRKGTDKKQASGHQDIADEEYPGNGLETHIKHPEIDPDQACRPAFTPGDRRHDLSTRLSQKFMDAHDSEA